MHVFEAVVVEERGSMHEGKVNVRAWRVLEEERTGRAEEWHKFDAEVREGRRRWINAEKPLVQRILELDEGTWCPAAGCICHAHLQKVCMGDPSRSTGYILRRNMPVSTDLPKQGYPSEEILFESEWSSRSTNTYLTRSAELVANTRLCAGFSDTS